MACSRPRNGNFADDRQRLPCSGPRNRNFADDRQRLPCSRPWNGNFADDRQRLLSRPETSGCQPPSSADGSRVKNNASADAKGPLVSPDTALEECVYTKQDIRLKIFMDQQAKAKALVPHNCFRDAQEGAAIPSEHRASRNTPGLASPLHSLYGCLSLATAPVQAADPEDIPTKNGRIVYSRELLLNYLYSPLCWVKRSLPKYDVVLDKPHGHALKIKDSSS
ncbi:uncharacterized protein LOC133355967 isoform X1 [Lethenteron reissneri]|uniref:uncharacterized protein LOC133355967 isoform X1 n=1 Tax=Lethenteron reissneri TaxID=7753 RepID=UPI002AB757C2|nr:uncharacterized protein LOC133355967 isoform X1 [Lethenteron reissneri]XP_061429412.1 uncharacterized protein LOC133355967 isoform X1 [Lethenteron reissneri]XP_061429413.1 uncharacterized protein LOC133355967 isoform X1 [Lethenteron reissneri]